MAGAPSPAPKNSARPLPAPRRSPGGRHAGKRGRPPRVVKDQLARLAASRVLLGVMTGENRAATMTIPIVSAFELWFQKDQNQRVLWPSTVQLSEEYFTTLCAHDQRD